MTIADDVLRAKQDFDDVYEAGRKAEYDEFWEAFQQGGTRTSYDHAFSRFPIWLSKPKYSNIAVISASNMFSYNELITDERIDLTEWANIDFSKSSGFSMAFYRAALSKIGIIDTRGANANHILAETFAYNADLHTIEGIILREDIKFSGTFTNLKKLEKLIVSGVIGQNGFDVSACTKLSKASILSILNALSTTTSGLIVTFSGAAVDKAFETSPGANDGRYSQWWDEWTTYQPLDGEFRGNWIFDLE